MKSNKMLIAISLALIFTLCFSTVAFAAVYTARYGDNTLKRSSTVKTVVKNVQADLTKNTTYMLTHDGIYGSNTYKAAWEFQDNTPNLTADGEVGKNTKTELYPLRDTNYFYQ